jgi:predicted alpha-1,2-mannosidase
MLVRAGGVLLATLALIGASPLAAAADPAAEVDPMIGAFGPGFVFPGAAVPFGMVQNSPDTRGPLAYSGYLWSDPAIQGFSLVHISGPGVVKAGDIPFMPTTGAVSTSDPNSIGSPFDHLTEHASPGYYRVTLARYLTNVELTASEHAAMQRYTFPPFGDANVIINPGRSVEGVQDGHIEITGPDEVSGWTKGRYPVYFDARFSTPFKSSGVFRQGKDAAGWVSFDAAKQRVITARIGISFVDVEGARRNLEAEAPRPDFDAMHAAARAAWNRALSSVDVDGGTASRRKVFYTALYHSLLHPNVFTDVDGRYLGFDDRPHRAKGRTQYANFSLWDTYKTQNQLLTLIAPGRYRDMLLSLLDDMRESGKLPRWGEQNTDPAHMSGDPAIPMIADGYCRGLLTRRDALSLYRAGIATAAKRPPSLDQLGYLPLEDKGSAAGTTLEYGIADFSLALLADGLGRRADAAMWLQRSLRYRNLIDPQTKFIRPRHKDGSWLDPFNPSDEAGFQEGNSWHYSWLAPQDARGLFARMGGVGVALDRLDQMFSLPPVIANLTNAFGTLYRTPAYAPGNEMDLQVPWMYAFAGAPWKGAKALARERTTFNSTMAGLPGNDDLGGLSAGYVLSALGFSPVTPGAPFYVIGSPAFPKVTLTLGNGRKLVVEAPGAGPGKPYVTGATLDGKPLGRAWFRDSEIARGGTLVLRMSSAANQSWGASDVPPSVSDGPGLARFGCAPRTRRSLGGI